MDTNAVKIPYQDMLTPRLERIMEHVNAQVAADIGTDHAYIPIELIRSGKAVKVIAADIRKGPLEIAEANVEKYGLSDQIETRLGAGLEVISEGEADVVIIAGMGGEMIAGIIAADEKKARASKLVLQPMNSQYELRKYLIENGFTIETEDIENEGHRVYNIMVVTSGEQAPFEKDIYYHIPKSLKEHPKFSLLADKKEREFRKIITGLENSKNCDEDKLDYYKKSLAALEEIKRC